MIPFLQQIAKIYLENERTLLHRYCFIFPNRRSGSFFRKYLVEESKEALILPEITTISDFVSSTSGSIEANRIDLLFLLYDEYRKISIEKNMEIAGFDQFVFWGDMILNDFNDIDKYLADANQLFTNVKEIKEISTTFLTQEQQQVIKEFFGEIPNYNHDVDDFWRHLNNDDGSDSEAKMRFIKLWEILYPLYKGLRNILIDEGKAYSGMQYRDTVDILKSLSAQDLPFNRYIFVGFNVLSTSEYQIFNILKLKGIADFYWDFNSPAISDRHNKAWKFISRYIKFFPSNYNLEEDAKHEFPEINIIAIPSNVGQVKYAGNIISNQIITGDISDTANAINTAIVLPDESLFLPAISSIPSDITNTNITMGLPLRSTAISSFMSAITSMHARSSKVKDEYFYFHEDIKNVISHPYVKKISPYIIDDILKYIKDNRAFIVSSKYLRSLSPEFDRIFEPVIALDNIREVSALIRSIIGVVEKHLLSEHEANRIDIGFINQYLTLLNQLDSIAGVYDFSMTDKTYFGLIERLVSTSTVTLEGEPLKGLQVMGMLETRNLDFENVTILSMNERVFPRKHFSRTFIPNNLRKGYGLATTEHQDSIFAYYFYRLLSRAKNVNLLYDSRTQNLSSGEPSRYIYQLKYIYSPANIKFSSALFHVSPPKADCISIEKTPFVMEKLNKFRTNGSQVYLSASSINKYLDCPLQFYFHAVENMKIDNEITEFIDSATFGTIIHDIMHIVYTENKKHKKVFDKQLLNSIKHSPLLSKIITREINRSYLKKKENRLDDPIVGEPLLVEDVIKTYIQSILDCDIELCPFIYEKGEEKELYEWAITDDITINFKQYIDRVDRINIDTPAERLRIVDYKTGNVNSSTNVDDMFESTSERKDKILQVMLYCNVYALRNKYDGAIQPILYKIKEVNTKSDFSIKINRTILEDYRTINEAFLSGFRTTIIEIFNPEIPFFQTKKEENCKYCNYKEFCNK